MVVVGVVADVKNSFGVRLAELGRVAAAIASPSY